MLVDLAERDRSPVPGDQEWVQLIVAGQQKWPVNKSGRRSKLGPVESGRSPKWSVTKRSVLEKVAKFKEVNNK